MENQEEKQEPAGTEKLFAAEPVTTDSLDLFTLINNSTTTIIGNIQSGDMTGTGTKLLNLLATPSDHWRGCPLRRHDGEECFRFFSRVRPSDCCHFYRKSKRRAQYARFRSKPAKTFLSRRVGHLHYLSGSPCRSSRTVSQTSMQQSHRRGRSNQGTNNQNKEVSTNIKHAARKICPTPARDG